ncbi:hypothetical protein GCM10008938_31240 [Deinococcus roseus]|uniref:Glycoside hydrolase family 5 domain-containing protein n=1 Tax=Deinococcus roseus TaxID=392414 RepID=A0ABQ2D4H7_9DEIO|nr:hypothetical protein GCM10008938_31240 [Deinococcus roseus]
MVSGSQILTMCGDPFIVKGASVAYHTFMDMEDGGYGQTDFDHLPEQLDVLKASGVNLVRVFVTPEMVNHTPSQWPMLDQVVTEANSRNLVVLISNSYSEYSTQTLNFLQLLANRYKSNPLVWLTPMNEPNCALRQDDPNIYCSDWNRWKFEHNQYIQAIRMAGFNNPILVNGVDYSWDLSKAVTTHKLVDPNNNLIYGAHRYGNENPLWNGIQASDALQKWGSLANTVPVVVDEVGADNGPGENGVVFVNSLQWMQGFLDFVSKWVQGGGGDGAIAFTSYTSDGNSLFEDAGYVNDSDFPSPVLPLQWSAWGNIYLERFLQATPK